MVYIPDDSDFSSFRDQCESLEGWHCRYNKAGVTVWSQGQEESCTVQKIKVSRLSPAPALCPAAPEGPWGLPRAGEVQSGLPGDVSAPGLAGLESQRCFPAAPQAAAAHPRGFTCRDRDHCSSGRVGPRGAAPSPAQAGRPRDQLHCGDGPAGSPQAQDGLVGHVPGVLPPALPSWGTSPLILTG